MPELESEIIEEHSMEEARDDASLCRIHLLDVGSEKYGDCILCEFGTLRILIDGAHPSNFRPRLGHLSIPQQLESLWGDSPFELDLLVVTHTHSDHIGCLPKLVESGIIKPRWALLADPDLGWGRSVDHESALIDPSEQTEVLAAALREETHSEERDETLELFFLDVINLEQSYRNMIDRLRLNGTRVVLFGRDEHDEMVQEFASIGMQILGPSPEHLRLCNEAIEQQGRDEQQAIADFQSSLDALNPDWLDAYRAVASMDGASLGAAVNNQSIVLCFDFQGRKVLLTGDMQFASPDIKGLDTEMRTLRRLIESEGPWSLVKVAHHGSYNAFDETVLLEMGTTRLFGISTGENSHSHPHPSILEMLDANKDRIKWARTDRNRAITFDFSDSPAEVILERGQINDSRPNERDEVEPSSPYLRAVSPTNIPGIAQAVSQQPPTPQSVPSVMTSELDDVVEVTTRIPRRATRVTVTIDVQPLDASPQATLPSEDPPPSTTSPPSSAPLLATPSNLPLLDPKAPRIGGGRQLPPLIFITNRSLLSRNIGAKEVDLVLRSVQESEHLLIDDVPSSGDALEAASVVVSKLLEPNHWHGIVILGGYDVVPAQRLDALPPHLRSSLPRSNDPDNFVVWSDALYSDADSDGFSEVPVSRIPDGKSASLMWAALQARPPLQEEAPQLRQGVANVRRPFAKHVFNELSGQGEMANSAPATCEHPPLTLDGHQIYLMLHGDHFDGSRFWGEDVSGGLEAVNLSNLPTSCEGTVFTGCCWGALTTEEPAAWASLSPLRVKTPETSLALGFLARGAQAFVGCTGAHYSPVIPPFNYFGGPLHRAFWSHYSIGSAPAKALLEAKIDFLQGMPHGQTSLLGQAIEHKILHQYTCLGLGW